MKQIIKTEKENNCYILEMECEIEEYLDWIIYFVTLSIIKFCKEKCKNMKIARGQI